MPACAQRLDAPSPKRAAETTVTGRGASFSAVKRPARPAPTMTMLPPAGRCRTDFVTLVRQLQGASSMVEIDHALDRHAGALGDPGIDRDFLFEEHQRL